MIPRGIDTAVFDPAAVARERVAALREAWRVEPGARIVLTPGRVAPWNGQILLPEVARILVEGGMRGIVFVVVGENRRHRNYARAILKQARAQGIAHLFRLTGHCPDMPAAFAAADIVVVPAIEPPILGRTVAQAQAMARPVITSDVGVLPEHVVAPPHFPEDVRTGWVTKAGDPTDIARALVLALALDRSSLPGDGGARANSPSTCFLPTALPWRRGRFIPRSWRAIASGWYRTHVGSLWSAIEPLRRGRDVMSSFPRA